MATPSSGEISFSDVRGEISTSSTAQVSLNDSLVLAMVAGETSGSEHSISEWYGKTAKPGEDWGTSMYTLYDNSLVGGYAQCVLSFLSNGTFQTRLYNGGANTTTTYDWSPIATSETASEYQIKWVMTAGNVTPGTGTSAGGTWASQNTWYTLSSGSRWLSMTDTSYQSGTHEANVTVTLRPFNNASLEVAQTFYLLTYYGPTT